MEGDPTFVNVQPTFVQQNLRELLDSHLPNQIAHFEESSVNLERVAAFCEANYLQSQNKAEALAETKRCALQSLASFAFMVGDLSRSLLNALELESLNLSDKTSQIQNIAQFVSIQKEKSARREIGKLTANKNLIRLNKNHCLTVKNLVRVLKRPPLDLPRTPVKRPKPDFLLTNENKENLFTPVENGLEMPEHEKSFPERFTCPNFWSDLKSDERLRSGENGEWVKGQDERLTIDGLLCLCDGQWLNADIIDCYLDLICRCSPRAHFIPTYAILSYGRKGTVPSEWYWQLAETDTIFAPAHLYNNHWAMAILDMRERTLRLMDSMNHGYTDTEKKEFMETIMNILRDVAILQKVDIGDRSAWDVQERLSVPQQRNGTDCGIFALLFAQYSLERRQLEFGQCHIPYFRRRICHDIISVILHDQKSPVNRSDETVVQCPFAL